jgi:hypothetical protein
MSSGTLYRVPLVSTDSSENISLPSSEFLRVIGFHSCYRGITVDQRLHKDILIVVEEHGLQGRYHGGINYTCLKMGKFRSNRATRYKVPEVIYN